MATTSGAKGGRRLPLFSATDVDCQTNNIFWKTEDSSAAHAYIPGVDMNGNKRTRNLKWKPSKEVHFKSPLFTNSQHTENVTSFPGEPMSENKTSRVLDKAADSTKLHNYDISNNETCKIFLKDLCQDDKLRVAHLILELAKLGDERDSAKEQLSKERGDFKVQIKHLTGQLKTLTDDHKQILCKMMDCQHLLSIYQHILTEVQEQKTTQTPHQTTQHLNTKENMQHGKTSPDCSCEHALKQQPVYNSAEYVSNQVKQCSPPSESYNSHSRSCFSLPATMPLSENSNNSNISNPCSTKSLNIYSQQRLLHHKRPNLASHVVRRDLKPAKYIFKTSPNDEPKKCARVEILRERPSENFQELGLKSDPSEKDGTSSNINFGYDLVRDKIYISKTRQPPPLSAEKMISSKDCLDTRKSRSHRLFGPLREPIMSSTQRSSEFGYSGSVCSQNTVDNVAGTNISKNYSQSAHSLPETLLSYKKLQPLNSAGILLSKDNPLDNYIEGKTSTLCSSVQSLPNVLLQAAYSRNSDLHNKAVLCDKTNEEGLHNTSFQSNSSKISQADLLTNSVNAEQFCQMDFEERRQFLVKQRELLNEERNHLMSILNHPDIKPLELNSISNCKKSLAEISFTSQPTPSRPQQKGNSNIQKDIEVLEPETLVKGESEFMDLSNGAVCTPNARDLPNQQNIEDSCSVTSEVSISSKQSSLCLADLIDSIESDTPLSHRQYSTKTSYKISPKHQNTFRSDKLEEKFENDILKDIFFLN